MLFREELWVSEHTLKVVQTSPKTRPCKKRQAGEVKGLESIKEIGIGETGLWGRSRDQYFSLLPKEGLLLTLDQASGVCDLFRDRQLGLMVEKSCVLTKILKEDFRVRERAEAQASLPWTEPSSMCSCVEIFPQSLGTDFGCAGSHGVFQDKRARSTNISHPLPKSGFSSGNPTDPDLYVTLPSFSAVPESQDNLKGWTLLQGGWMFGREGDNSLILLFP